MRAPLPRTTAPSLLRISCGATRSGPSARARVEHIVECIAEQREGDEVEHRDCAGDEQQGWVRLHLPYTRAVEDHRPEAWRRLPHAEPEEGECDLGECDSAERGRDA